ncbi:biotin transport system substrate-specific component [Crossiella equi]|uniref:Biotin transporter n=1 Tax=Crossiella equi TaxID=130796 RepID=A0ABS5AJH1_9PSEU|nr:biotin transporter BioY [Crossiella equi]MBP2476720.1 biotin transport system substrate-specific component [Crossiella equi]
MSVLAVSQRRPVLADLVPGALVRDIALVLGGAALTGLAAQVAVPIPGSPVPVTAQTFAALLVGASLGWRRGALSMLVYLLAGLAGVPWHTGAGSATIGYIVGFVAAGALVGALAQRGGDRTVLRTVGTMLLGNAMIYAVGVPWLMVAADFTLSEALLKGLVPFLIGDLVKTALAAGVLPSAWKLVGRRDS